MEQIILHILKVRACIYGFDGYSTVDEYDNIVSKTKAEMEKLDEKLVQLTSGDKSFVVTSSYLLDLTRIAGKLFKSSKPELKSKILSLVLSNLELDNKKLHFNLLSPFDRLLAHSQSSNWLTTIEEVITLIKTDARKDLLI
ncbi:MAG: hypothetical protein WAS27_01655 [Candidatus Saccharimonadales bacterium]